MLNDRIQNNETGFNMLKECNQPVHSKTDNGLYTWMNKILWKDQLILQRNITDRQVWERNRSKGLDLDVDVSGDDDDHDTSVNGTGNLSL